MVQQLKISDDFESSLIITTLILGSCMYSFIVTVMKKYLSPSTEFLLEELFKVIFLFLSNLLAFKKSYTTAPQKIRSFSQFNHIAGTAIWQDAHLCKAQELKYFQEKQCANVLVLQQKRKSARAVKAVSFKHLLVFCCQNRRQCSTQIYHPRFSVMQYFYQVKRNKSKLNFHMKLNSKKTEQTGEMV